MAEKGETVNTVNSALDLDLRRGGAETVPPEPGPDLGPGAEPPRREARGTEKGREDAGGAPAERGTDGGARVRSMAGTATSRGGLTPRRSPCGGGRTVLPSGGAGACQRAGRARRPRGRRAPVGPGDRAGEPGPVGPGESLRMRAHSDFVPQSQTPARASAAAAGQGTPGAGAGPGAGRPAAGREPDAVECTGVAAPLLDKGHRIPSLKVDFNDLFSPKTAGDVYHNGRILLTPSGEVIEQVVASRPIFKEGGWEEVDPPAKKVEKGRRADGAPMDARGANRAKKELFRAAACNPDLSVFVTFTQSPELVNDRYDYKEAVRRLGMWLDNRVRRHGLKYIMVPELHQDGAIHWHGLITEAGVKLVDSGHRDKKGAIIYNVLDWHWGFTTATKVRDHAACCRYVSKYISKQMGGAGTIGGRYWLHGGALAKPIEQLFDASVPEGGKRVEIEEAKLVLWYGGKLTK